MGRQIKWTDEKILRMQTDGRGKGIGNNYDPWIHVSDLSSRGNSRRFFSQKTGRVHHLLSDVEWQLFLLLEFAPDVTDIREQYPLSREETLTIAAELRIKHPVYPGTKVTTVMSCDFLVTRSFHNSPILEAYNCKCMGEAENTRSLEKLELQRRYFDEKGIAHHLIFDSLLPKTKIKNIEWIRAAQFTDHETVHDKALLQDHCKRIAYELAKHIKSCSLAEYCENYETRTGAEPGIGLRAIRLLLFEGTVVTDMNQSNLAAAPITIFQPVTKSFLHLVGEQ